VLAFAKFGWRLPTTTTAREFLIPTKTYRERHAVANNRDRMEYPAFLDNPCCLLWDPPAFMGTFQLHLDIPNMSRSLARWVRRARCWCWWSGHVSAHNKNSNCDNCAECAMTGMANRWMQNQMDALLSRCARLLRDAYTSAGYRSCCSVTTWITADLVIRRVVLSHQLVCMQCRLQRIAGCCHSFRNAANVVHEMYATMVKTWCLW